MFRIFQGKGQRVLAGTLLAISCLYMSFLFLIVVVWVVSFSLLMRDNEHYGLTLSEISCHVGLN